MFEEDVIVPNEKKFAEETRTSCMRKSPSAPAPGIKNGAFRTLLSLSSSGDKLTSLPLCPEE